VLIGNSTFSVYDKHSQQYGAKRQQAAILPAHVATCTLGISLGKFHSQSLSAGHSLRQAGILGPCQFFQFVADRQSLTWMVGAVGGAELGHVRVPLAVYANLISPICNGGG